MEVQAILIRTSQTYKLDQRDINYLNFFSNKILGVKESIRTNMTCDWNTKYSQEDFRHYLNQMLSKFNKKITTLNEQIQSFQEQKKLHAQFAKYNDYFTIFARIQNQQTQFLKRHIQTPIYTTNEQKSAFLSELDGKCRQILWKIDSMKTPIATRTQKILSTMQEKNNKIKVYEQIINQINDPLSQKRTINTMDNVTLVNKNVMESLLKFVQTKMTNLQQKNQYYNQVLGYYMVAISEITEYLKGNKNLSATQKKIYLSQQYKQKDQDKKFHMAHYIIKYMIDQLKNIQLLRFILKVDDKNKIKQNKINWQAITKQVTSSYIQSVKNNLSQQALNKASQKLKSFADNHSDIAKLVKKLDKYRDIKQKINIFKAALKKINARKFNLDQVLCANDVLDKLDCQNDQKSDFQRQLQRQIVYGLLLELAEDKQLSKKQTYLRMVTTRKQFTFIKKMKGVEALNDCFIIKKQQIQDLQKCKKLIKEILIQQFKHEKEDELESWLYMDHTVHSNLQKSIFTLKNKLEKRQKKQQVNDKTNLNQIKTVQFTSKQKYSYVKDNFYSSEVPPEIQPSTQSNSQQRIQQLMVEKQSLQQQIIALLETNQSLEEQNNLLRSRLKSMETDDEKTNFQNILKQTRQNQLDKLVKRESFKNSNQGQIYEQQIDLPSQMQVFLQLLLKVWNQQSQESMNKYQKRNYAQFDRTIIKPAQQQKVYNQLNTHQLAKLFDKQQIKQIHQTMDYMLQKCYEAGKTFLFQPTTTQPPQTNEDQTSYSSLSGQFQVLNINELIQTKTTSVCLLCQSKQLQLEEQKLVLKENIEKYQQQILHSNEKIEFMRSAISNQQIRSNQQRQINQIKDKKLAQIHNQLTQTKVNHAEEIKQIKHNLQLIITQKQLEKANLAKTFSQAKIQHEKNVQKLHQDHAKILQEKDSQIKRLTQTMASLRVQSQENICVPQQIPANMSEKQARTYLIERQRDQLRRNQRKLKQQAKQRQRQLQAQIKEIKVSYTKQLQVLTKTTKDAEYQLAQIKRRQLNSANNPSENKSLTNELSSRQKLELNKLKTEHEQYKKLTQSLQNQLQTEKKTNKNKVKQLEQKLQETQNINDELKMQVMAIKHFVQQSSEKKETTSPQSSLVFFDRYFMGNILEDQYEKKYQLLNLIQQKTRQNIKKTRLLYKFDKLNPTSFHTYIDGLNNFLIIVQTRKNIFGAFSTAKIQPRYREPEDTRAFIFSYYVPGQISWFDYVCKKETAKSLTYDEYFLIVGNSQIRLKFGQSLVYSNFGIVNGYYDPKGTNVEALINAQQQRQDALVSYECFEVVFEEERF